MTNFIAKYKKDNRNYTIYDVRNDKNGFPQFLIYIEGQWKYISAKHFIPYDFVSISSMVNELDYYSKLIKGEE